MAIERKKLSSTAMNAIESAQRSGELVLSDMTLWEIAWLQKRERLAISVPYSIFIREFLDAYTFQIVPISAKIAEQAANFPSEINNDPADRIISATSIIMDAPLVTADKNLRKSKLVKTIW
jgi:PIN domain nuclease of toxin-antitoxin system